MVFTDARRNPSEANDLGADFLGDTQLLGILESGGPDPSEYDLVLQWIKRAATSPAIAKTLRRALSATYVTDSIHGLGFLKPHGYAGDFEIIDRLYTRRKSRDPLLTRWDRFCLDSDAAEAVRNRMAFFHAELTRLSAQVHRPRVLNLASGPGRDVAEFFRRHPESGVEVHCVDLDARALAYSEALCRLFNDRVSFEQANALSYRPPPEHFDLVWSAGLMDYVSDRAFVAIIRRLFSGLKPGGRMIVGNFGPDNPSKDYMEVFSDWVLTHRSEEALLVLASRAGLSDTAAVEREPLGVNLFLTVTKPATGGAS